MTLVSAIFILVDADETPRDDGRIRRRRRHRNRS
jgi:hypothetical protein